MLIKIKSNSSVVRVKDVIAAQRRPIARDINTADLIFHEIKCDDGFEVKEWIIINPLSVEYFTAVPDALRAFFKEELIKLENPLYGYPDEVAHTLQKFPRISSKISLTVVSPGIRRRVVIPRLKSMVDLPTSRIPVALRNPFPVKIPQFFAYRGRIVGTGNG
ncbi:MAG: hypothetical protein ACYCPQ_04025 [Elusimicrobiota bacterium]